MGAGGASQASESQEHARTMERGGEYFLPPSMLQRIRTEFPQDSFSRGHMGTEVSVNCSEPPKEAQRVLETYRACVLTLSNAQEWPALRKLQDLSLKELT